MMGGGFCVRPHQEPEYGPHAVHPAPRLVMVLLLHTRVGVKQRGIAQAGSAAPPCWSRHFWVLCTLTLSHPSIFRCFGCCSLPPCSFPSLLSLLHPSSLLLQQPCPSFSYPPPSLALSPALGCSTKSKCWICRHAARQGLHCMRALGSKSWALFQEVPKHLVPQGQWHCSDPSP